MAGGTIGTRSAGQPFTNRRSSATTAHFPKASAPPSRLIQALGPGFTLIELLVLLVVIGVLALIIIPQIVGATRRSNEAALRGDLRSLRVAIEHFHADCGGYPPRLDDILAWRGEDVSAPADGTGRELDLSSFHGPYLRTGTMLLPYDPMTDRRDWRYDSALGQIHSASDRIAANGVPYSQW